MAVHNRWTGLVDSGLVDWTTGPTLLPRRSMIFSTSIDRQGQSTHVLPTLDNLSIVGKGSIVPLLRGGAG